MVRESAPSITPSLKVTAMMEVPRLTSPFFRRLMSTLIPFILAVFSPFFCTGAP